MHEQQQVTIGQSLPAQADSSGTGVIKSIKAIIVLAGSIRVNSLTDVIGRPLLDLPIDDQRTTMTHWLDHAKKLAQTVGDLPLPVRVMLNESAKLPQEPGHVDEQIDLHIENDPQSFRGTGGLLHDLGKQYEDDDLLVVASGGQIFLEPLEQLVAGLAGKQADICLISHADGAPCSVMLVRVSALRAIPDKGFIDFKEQALPLIAQTHQVRVWQRPEATALPFNTRQQYIAALRYYHQYHQHVVDASIALQPMAEDWQSSFAIIEPNATVSSTAQIHNSVVLGDAIVESGAVVVRSIIGPGAIVGKRRAVVDSAVTQLGKK